MAGKKLYVHVKNNGNQVFYKGDSVENDGSNLISITHEGDTVAVICLADGESVGEWFDTTKHKAQEQS